MNDTKNTYLKPMEEDGDFQLISSSPSFRQPVPDNGGGAVLDSPQKISAAITRPDGEDDGDYDEDDDTSSDFDFAFVIRDPESGPAITADEIFSNGQIRPIYPVFDRSLLLAGDSPAVDPSERAPRAPLRSLLIAEREEAGSGSGSSSENDELEKIPPGTYCVWTPRSTSASSSPDRCRKSSSTGSSIRFRLRDLVVGRSNSDGKEKFVFLAAEGKPVAAVAAAEKGKEKRSPDRGQAQTKGAAAEKDTKGRAKKVADVGMGTAHRLYYGKLANGSGRRSYLPYRPGVVGFFANVNGFRRTHHPF